MINNFDFKKFTALVVFIYCIYELKKSSEEVGKWNERCNLLPDIASILKDNDELKKELLSFKEDNRILKLANDSFSNVQK